MPKESYIVVNGVPTHVMSWGDINPWDENSAGFGDKQEVIICVPGNPGLPGFYTHFLSTVYNSIQEEIPVWILGHAGHDIPSNINIPELQNNEDLYNLKGQLQHKISFIEKYVPENVKIYLIGHSIGAWMILELLKEPSVRKRIKHTYLLFPTIERMKLAQNGRVLSEYIAPIYPFLKMLLFLFTHLPMSFRIVLVYMVCLITFIPVNYIGTIIKFLNYKSNEKSFRLGIEEMNTVKELDYDIVEPNHNILKLYYGANDGWAPVEYCHQLKRKYPDIDAEICSRNMRHGFMLKSSAKMGYIVGDWILEKRGDNQLN